MNVEIIRDRLKEFRPFAVVTSSGNKYVVPHTDFILLHQRTVVVVNRRGGAVVIDPLHVVGLEDILTRKNGHHKARRAR